MVNLSSIRGDYPRIISDPQLVHSRYNLRSRAARDSSRRHGIHDVSDLETIELDDNSARVPFPSTEAPSETEYQRMMYERQNMPLSQGLLAAFFAWIMLAGFVVFPSTIERYMESQTRSATNQTTSSASSSTSSQATILITHLQNAQLLAVAITLCILALMGHCYLWYKHRANHIWLKENIFFPDLDKAALGLFSTVVQVRGSNRNENLSPTAVATLVVTSVLTVVMAVGFYHYNFVMISRAKRLHDEAMGLVVEVDTFLGLVRAILGRWFETFWHFACYIGGEVKRGSQGALRVIRR